MSLHLLSASLSCSWKTKKPVRSSKFHAVQSIAASVAFWIVTLVITTVTFGFGGLCVPLLWLVFLYWAYKAYQGEMVEIPVLTNFIKGQGWA